MKTEKEIMEVLADIEHERWADWQRWVNSIIINKSTDELKSYVERWNKQINTKYSDLSEEDKQKDRNQVMRYWNIIYPKPKRTIFDLTLQELKELSIMAIYSEEPECDINILDSKVYKNKAHVQIVFDLNQKDNTYVFTITKNLDFQLNSDWKTYNVQNQAKLRERLNEMLTEEMKK